MRAALEFPNLIIGVTGNALDDDVAAFLGAGADMVLAKPLLPHQLDALLAFTSEYGFKSIPGSFLQMIGTGRQDTRVTRSVRTETVAPLTRSMNRTTDSEDLCN